MKGKLHGTWIWIINGYTNVQYKEQEDDERDWEALWGNTERKLETEDVDISMKQGNF